MGAHVDLWGPMGAYRGLWDRLVTYEVYGDIWRPLET